MLSLKTLISRTKRRHKVKVELGMENALNVYQSEWDAEQKFTSYADMMTKKETAVRSVSISPSRVDHQRMSM